LAARWIGTGSTRRQGQGESDVELIAPQQTSTPD